MNLTKILFKSLKYSVFFPMLWLRIPFVLICYLVSAISFIGLVIGIINYFFSPGQDIFNLLAISLLQFAVLDFLCSRFFMIQSYLY
jgi:hypothetical protein